MSRGAGAAVAGLVAAVLVAAGPAAAQSPATAPPAGDGASSPPAPVVAPVPAPAPAGLSTRLEGAHRSSGRPYLLRGEKLRVRGVLRPYAPGQRVTVRVYRASRELVERTLTVRAVPGTTDGAFALDVPAPRGRLQVRAVHPASPELAKARAPNRSVSVLKPAAAAGDRGPLVALLQRGLARLAYAVPRESHFDAGTARAVIAYRKVNAMPRTSFASREVVERVLSGRGAFVPKHPRAGRHAEADLSRQVMALVDRGRVQRTYHVSSGAPATPTILGSFRIYRKQSGINALGMVHSSYFRGGYAIHGYASVPTYNASHGCLRVPIPDARHVYDWLRTGDGVIVYP